MFKSQLRVEISRTALSSERCQAEIPDPKILCEYGSDYHRTFPQKSQTSGGTPSILHDVLKSFLLVLDTRTKISLRLSGNSRKQPWSAEPAAKWAYVLIVDTERKSLYWYTTHLFTCSSASPRSSASVNREPVLRQDFNASLVSDRPDFTTHFWAGPI